MSGKVVIIGGCAGAKVAWDAFTSHSYFLKCGHEAFFMDNHTEDWSGMKPLFIDRTKGLELISKEQAWWFVATGDNVQRQAIMREIETLTGWKEPTNAIHESAGCGAYAQLGHGILLCAQSFVGVGSVIGDGVIINTAATVDHDCRVGDFAQIGPGAHLAGYVEVGERANIGTGACVIPHIKIGKDATVAAGAVVIHDVEDGDTVMGVPAHSKRHGHYKEDNQ
jgi:sugar O-acyltransferase (sialic acid O-acetyltransferase NeuD family)